jgi:hypothetical protein
MITIRTSTYESKSSYEVVFTRIRLDVERVSVLVNPLFGKLTVDTNKPWVGKINGSEGTFKVVQTNSSILPLRYFEGNFFTLFVHGEVVSEEHITRINLKFKLGWHAAFTFLLTYLFPMILAIRFINEDNWESVKELTLWLLAFCAIPTLLLIAQLNRTENRISNLLGAE